MTEAVLRWLLPKPLQGGQRANTTNILILYV